MVCQLCQLRRIIAGDCNGRGAAVLQFLQALDHLHRLPGIREHDAHIARLGVACLQPLGVPVLVDDTGLAQTQKFQICILGDTQRGAKPEQVDGAAVDHQLHTALQLIQQQKALGIPQALDVLLGHLVHDLLQAVLRSDVPLLMAAVLAQCGKLERQRMAQLLVALKPHRAADTHHAGRRRKGRFRQLPNGHHGGFRRVCEDKTCDLALGAAERGLDLTQAQQDILHKDGSFSGWLAGRLCVDTKPFFTGKTLFKNIVP